MKLHPYTIPQTWYWLLLAFRKDIFSFLGGGTICVPPSGYNDHTLPGKASKSFVSLGWILLTKFPFLISNAFVETTLTVPTHEEPFLSRDFSDSKCNMVAGSSSQNSLITTWPSLLWSNDCRFIVSNKPFKEGIINICQDQLYSLN